MTLIQKLAELNLFIQRFDDCTIIQDDVKYHMEIEDIPFKLLITDVVNAYYDVENNEHIFILKGSEING